MTDRPPEPRPPGAFRIRSPTIDDAAALADLMNACSEAEGGVATDTTESALGRLQEPGRDLAADNAVVEAEDGRPAAYLSLEYEESGALEVLAMGFVHPDWWDRGLGSFLVELGEVRAARRSRPDGSAVTVRVARWSVNEAAARLFADHGYEVARRFWRMVVDLVDPIPESALPPGVSPRPFVDERDATAVHAMFAEAFGAHWGMPFEAYELWRHTNISGDGANFDPSLWRVAVEGDEVVGAALGVAGSSEDPDRGVVSLLGVRSDHRRRGTGLALLQSAFRGFQQRGLSRAGLSVDSSNTTGATRLYERAGMRVERAFDIWEKVVPASG